MSFHQKWSLVEIHKIDTTYQKFVRLLQHTLQPYTYFHSWKELGFVQVRLNKVSKFSPASNGEQRVSITNIN